MTAELEVFEEQRPVLLSLAYRMLGDMSRAEDVVQEAWLRWRGSETEVESPRAFLVTTVSRLCLDELTSSRVQREETGNRLPEPVDLKQSGLSHVELADQVSMAFLVVLQKLNPLERAVFLLHEVFDLSHGEIARMLDKTEAACRQSLARAKEHVAEERRNLVTPPEEQRRLLLAFVRAIRDGEVEPLFELLADDAVFIADNQGRRFGKIRAVSRPVVGRVKIAALAKAISNQPVPKGRVQECTLNGQPAVVLYREGQVSLAILVDVREGKIQRVFVQANPDRLKHLGPLN